MGKYNEDVMGGKSLAKCGSVALLLTVYTGYRVVNYINQIVDLGHGRPGQKSPLIPKPLEGRFLFSLSRILRLTKNRERRNENA